jgi:glycosyltransferase involved in cell wall biosynthesis
LPSRAPTSTGDLSGDDLTLGSLGLASACVVLQPLALDQLPAEVWNKTRVILQSASPPPSTHAGRRRGFTAAVLAHLREVKDPRLAARAVGMLAPRSAVRVVHMGAALDDGMEAWARAETSRNPRYEWRGDVPHWRAMRVLARSHVMALTSKAEGGANAVSEALAAGVPVLSTRVDGSVGILGDDYPGYFERGRSEQLAALLERAEEDTDFYELLGTRCEALRPLVSPGRERQAWADLLAAL